MVQKYLAGEEPNGTVYVRSNADGSKKIIQNNYRTARYDLKIMPNCFGYVKGHDTVNGKKNMNNLKMW